MRFCLMILMAALMPTTALADPIPNEMVLVPHGTFIMGEEWAYCGEDEHEVTLTRDYWLGQHEVTNQEYMEAVQWAYDNGYVNANMTSVWDNLDGSVAELLALYSIFSEIQFDGTETFYLRESPSAEAQFAYPDGYDPADHPVHAVTWYGSVRYCDWLSLQAELPRAYEHDGDWSCNGGDPYGAQGYRLPTDAEWEYAAQFDDGRIYPWGGEDPDCSRANWAPPFPLEICVGWTTPVGNYPDAPETLGLTDMPGNVFEWCNDWWECDLGMDPVIDPVGPGSGGFRVHRGGAFEAGQHYLMCASRAGAPPDYGTVAGFRVARTFTFTGSDVEDNHGRSQLHLGINQPNPFTGLTHITSAVPPGSSATLAVYDASGRLVRTLASGQLGGEHTISWNGTNDAGDPVEAGAYFYRLIVGNTSISRQMLLLK